MPKQKFFSAFIVIILIGAFYPLLTSAIGFGGISARPANPDPGDNRTKSWFIYNLGPGESKEDAVIVVNGTDSEQTIRIYVVDSLASNIGAFALKKENAEKDFVGVWIKLEKDRVTLPPKSETHVKFTITIPEDVDVGEHSGGIIVQAVKPAVELEQTGAVINTRVGVRVYETVPGEVIKKLAIGSLTVEKLEEKNGYLITLSGENKGTITLTSEASLDISGWGLISFKEIFKSFEQTKEWQIMRGKRAEKTWEWPVPKFGRFILKAAIDYESGAGPETLETAPLVLWVIPKKETGILIAVALLIIAYFVGQKIRNSGRGWNLYKVKKGDDIVTLGEKYGISWKRLAKVNEIKKPYLLKKGASILVPAKAKISAKEQGGEKSITTTSKKLKKGIILVIIIVIILGGLAIYRKYIYKPKPGQDKEAPLVTLPLPKPKPLTKSDVKIAIYDFGQEQGNFVAELKDKLGELEYPEITLATTTEEIIVSHFSTPTEATTTILYKKDGEEKLELLKKDLLKEGAEVKTEALESLEPDIMIGNFRLEDLNLGLGIIDKSKVTIQVLNGGAEKGTAGKLSEKLEAEGYDVLKPANADKFDYQGLNIYYQTDFMKVSRILEELLKEKYEPVVLEEKEGIETNIEIIIGE